MPDLALMGLRQTFGGAPGPALFSEISTSIADLANALARMPKWDENTLHSCYSDLVGAAINKPDNVPFTPALPMHINPKADGFMTCNNFIDDLIATWVEFCVTDNTRAVEALLASLDTVVHPSGQASAQRRPLGNHQSHCKGYPDGTPHCPRLADGHTTPSHQPPR